LATGRQLTASDLDSVAAFLPRPTRRGCNHYGKFAIDKTGAWTYATTTAHNEFVGGQTYTDSFTVATADGTTQVVTVSILGTNDPAVNSGASTPRLTEPNARLSTGGQPSASQ